MVESDTGVNFLGKHIQPKWALESEGASDELFT